MFSKFIEKNLDILQKTLYNSKVRFIEDYERFLNWSLKEIDESNYIEFENWKIEYNNLERIVINSLNRYRIAYIRFYSYKSYIYSDDFVKDCYHVA